MAFNNQNNTINGTSIIHGNRPPQPSFLQTNRNLQSTQFGTNTGTLHTQLLPDITPNNNNNKEHTLHTGIIITVSKNNTNNNNNNNNNQQSNNQNNESHMHQNNDNEPLSSNIIKLKHKLRELIEYKYNFKDNKTRKYFSLCSELHEIYCEEYMYEDTNSPPSKSLNEITILGQTLYLLSIYELECENIEISHEYIIRALMYWRCANKCALRMGTTIKPKYKTNKSLLNEIFCNVKYPKINKTNLDINDLGFFWPQLVQCYIGAGNIFLKHFEYDVSSLMYRTSLELCHCMEGRYHFSCIDSLEYLMTLCIIKHDIEISIIYCREILSILSYPNNILIANEYKYINTKALYSCLLRLSSNKNNIAAGYKLKEECIAECPSGHIFNLYIYFIKHCIQSSAHTHYISESEMFIEADEMINYLSNIFIKHCIQQSAQYIDEKLIFIEADEMINYLSNTFAIQRQLKYYEEYWLCDLFKEYLFIISEQAIMKYGINAASNNNNNNINEEHHHIKRLNFLYPLHIKHIDSLNKNPMAKQYNRNCIINKIKVIACYADTFEAYQDVNRANKLRQQINQQR